MVPQNYFRFKASDVASRNRKKIKKKKFPCARELCNDKAILSYVQRWKKKHQERDFVACKTQFARFDFRFLFISILKSRQITEQYKLEVEVNLPYVIFMNNVTSYYSQWENKQYKISCLPYYSFLWKLKHSSEKRILYVCASGTDLLGNTLLTQETQNTSSRDHTK